MPNKLKKLQVVLKYVVRNRKEFSFIRKTCGSFFYRGSLLIFGGVIVAYLYILSLVFQHSLAHFLVVNFTQLGVSTCYQYYNILQFLYLLLLLLFSSHKTNLLNNSNNKIKNKFQERLTNLNFSQRLSIFIFNCLWYFLDRLKITFLTICRIVMRIIQFLSPSEDKEILLKPNITKDCKYVLINDFNRKSKMFKSELTRSSSPTPMCDIETAEASKPNPVIRICNAKPYTSHESGRHAGQEKLEKKTLKKTSYERILSSFNFDEMAPEQSCCEYFTPKELKPCCKRSSSTEYNEKKTQKGSKPMSSCVCVGNTGKQAQITPIKMTSTPYCCNEPSTNSRCQESLLERIRAYLQTLITSHRINCQRCNQMRYNDSMNARPSNNSNACKESLLEQALSYLRKITLDHVDGCARCQQKPSGCNSNETTSYLQTMLEQAWSYLKKLRSDDPKTGCPSCKESGRRVCCTHSTTREQCPTREPCPKREPCLPKEPFPTRQPNQGILKYPSRSTCQCDSKHSIIKEFPKKQPCATENVKQSCPETCEGKPPQPLKPLPRLCRSEEERTFDKDSPYIPYCKQPSRHSRLQIYTGSHDKACCLSQLDLEKLDCTVAKQKSCGSITLSLDQCKSINASKKNCSVESIISQEILEYHSSAKCAGPCGKSNSNSAPKQGFSLSKEPNDHRFCTRPNECKHSKQSLAQSECYDTCLAPCNKNPDEEEKAKNVCGGGCARCNYTSNAHLCQEQRTVDAKYEAYLDKKYGDIVKLLDKATNCDSGCCCVTCNKQGQIPEGPKADPHNYRYYW